MAKVVCKQPKTKPCDVCGSPITGFPSDVSRRRYCSRQCSASTQVNKLRCVCETCGAPFMRIPSHVRRRGGHFCSDRCRGVGLTLGESFWNKVNKNGPIPQHMPHLGPCWLWTASLDSKGYGQLMSTTRSMLRAHRVSWELHHGPPPENTHVLHHCDTRNCVRIGHLFLGTHIDNMADMMSKGRHALGTRTGAAKLTETTVKQIRERYMMGGVSYKKLGASFGVNAQTTWDVVNRRTWKHIP